MPERFVYSSFKVGGDPTRIAFLANDLDEKLRSLQKAGWTIDSVNQIDNNRAWEFHKQMYVSTPEYIIIAKQEVER